MLQSFAPLTKDCNFGSLPESREVKKKLRIVMEVSYISMAIEASVPLFLNKLQNLLSHEGFVYLSPTVVASAITELNVISGGIRGAEEKVMESFWRLLLSMDDFIDTFIIKIELRRQNSFIKIVPPLIRLASLHDEISLKKVISEVFRQAKALNEHCATGSHRQLPPLIKLDGAPDGSDFISLYDKEDELEDQLFDSKHRKSETVIAVIGKAGSGKTFLTKTIYNKKNIKRVFNYRAWVNVSENFEARDYLVDILKQLRESVDNNSPDDELELRLDSFLKEKRCLIVVDDVRTSNDFDQLSIVLKCIGGLSRLILTTGNQDIARAASPWRNPVRLRSLTDEESWALFSKKVRKAEDDPDLLRLQDEILRKCGGSPQTILILGGLLPARDLEEWVSVIEQLSKKPSEELSKKIKSGVSLSEKDFIDLWNWIDPAPEEKALALSYHDLPYQMRFCFLYLGLFPRAFLIPVRRLFRHWLAEGSVISLPEEEQMAPEEEQEDLAWKYFKQLISRNMIEVTKWRLDGSPKTCRMPTNTWDMFHSKALGLRLLHDQSNITYTSAVSSESRIQQLVKHAGIQNYLSSNPHIQNVRSYVSLNAQKRDSPNQDVGMFLNKVVNRRGFGLLIVLDLEHVYKPTLHETIGKMLNLKYLGLRWTSLDSLPISVGYLPYLETLDVKHTNILTIPSSIWMAKNLRHLYLNEIYFDTPIKEPNSGSLTNIRTLWGLFIGPKSLAENCLDKLIGLRKLGLTYTSESVRGAIADWISNLTSLQFLRLRSRDKFGRPSTLELRDMSTNQKLSDLYLLGQLPKAIDELQFPPTLKILTLSVSQLENDPMPILGKLPRLNILRLLRHSYKGKTMTCFYDGFPVLRVLKLWMLEDLESWILEEGAMPQLGDLEIRRCLRLKQLEKLQLIENLKVTLTNMPEEFVAKFKRDMVNADVTTLTRVLLVRFLNYFFVLFYILWHFKCFWK